MSRRVLLGLAVAAAGAIAVLALALVVATREGEDERVPVALRAGDPGKCRGLGGAAARACFEREFLAMVRGDRDPRRAVDVIAEEAWKTGGSLLSDCHGIMHTVGRTYAGERKLTLASLVDFLPRSNDPGCTAGFAHGMVTAIAPGIDPERPGEAERVCGEAGTRYQRYSCIHGVGHAFMRMYTDQLEPSLHLCRALGDDSAPDCAQGAYHDYWFAIAGVDGASLDSEPVTNPRELCGAQPAAFVRPCWYRAFIESRPENFALATPEDLDGLCGGLTGLQRSACITGASVIGPPDPAEQVELCARMGAPSDAASCVRGVKVQNLRDARVEDHVALLRGCERFAERARAACRRWLAKTIAVLTDGTFAQEGCPRLDAARARRDCREGAASMEDALVTFS